MRDRRKQDHPRRCGENSMELIQNAYQGGSPPQVRGKQQSPFKKVAGFRITPAGAGKTRLAEYAQQLAEDHPRRCGENLWAWFIVDSIRGSPPQVRGKLKNIQMPQ